MAVVTYNSGKQLLRWLLTYLILILIKLVLNR